MYTTLPKASTVVILLVCFECVIVEVRLMARFSQALPISRDSRFSFPLITAVDHHYFKQHSE